MVATNLSAAFYLTHASVPIFRAQQGGILVHISSVAARKPDRSGIAYQATKAGVAALAHGTMEEERDHGLCVTVIYPVMDDGVHAIDTLRWLCGGEVTGIHAMTREVGTPDINFMTAMLEFDNGSTGILLNSWTSGRRIFAVEMHAPGICAEAEHEVAGYLYADGDTRGQRYDSREVAGSDHLYMYGGFQAKHREFADAVRTKTQPSSHFADAVKTMEVAEKILAMNILGIRHT